MRCLMIALAVGSLAACEKKVEEPPPAVVVPTPPAVTINMADVPGTWDIQVMGMASDSVLTTGTLVATGDTGGWMMTFMNRDPMALQVSIAGDSIVAQAPEYESVLRKGVMVRTTSVYRMVGPNLNGLTTATYKGVGADSVVMLRTIGTRKTM
ncbi:MAG: hypothetical protein ABIR59_03150 [Gemmatimonadales bacterium]